MAAQAGEGFLATFDGAPTSPQPFRPRDWALTFINSAGGAADVGATGTGALSHGPDCSAPPDTHSNGGLIEQSLFLCRDHLMTGGVDSMNLQVMPPALLDFSQGTAFLRWDQSTATTNGRDWTEMWVVPYADDYQMSSREEEFPANAIRILARTGPPEHPGWIVQVFKNRQRVSETFSPDWDKTFALNAARRDTFELQLSQGHLKFWSPGYNQVWVEQDVALDWNVGTVYLAHDAYNPHKDGPCPSPGTLSCGVNTWHWDNLSLSPARPFTIINADRRVANAAAPTLTFDRPAPAGAQLRWWSFGGLNMQVQFDGGPWLDTEPLGVQPTADKAHAFRVPAPQGARVVRWRGDKIEVDWAGWSVADATLISLAAPDGSAPPPTPVPVATEVPPFTPTLTPLPSSTMSVTATNVPTHTPSPVTATVSPSASPTPTPSATPTPPTTDVPCSLEGRVLTCVLPRIV